MIEEISISYVTHGGVTDLLHNSWKIIQYVDRLSVKGYRFEFFFNEIFIFMTQGKKLT